MHRPATPEDQQEVYSAKKKCFTINNLLTIDETCQICFLGATDGGEANNTILAELEGYRLLPRSYLYHDMGFQGFVLADVTMIQPQKAPHGGELTPPEKATNCLIVPI